MSVRSYRGFKKERERKQMLCLEALQEVENNLSKCLQIGAGEGEKEKPE